MMKDGKYRNEDETATFGFSTVSPSRKTALVRGVFDSVASRYDLMNDLMSAGMHRLWKSFLVDRLMPRPGQLLLDVAGGTGDIACGFVGRANGFAGDGARPPARAVVCDINMNMLAAGIAGNRRHADSVHISRVCGDAGNLPVSTRSIDTYAIAFGIRNVACIDTALCEAARVLKYGGSFVCLEFSSPVTGGLRKLYDACSFNLVPWLGKKVAGDADAYRYLVESIRRFPSRENFAARIRKAGFSRVKYETLTGGVVALHTGWRI